MVAAVVWPTLPHHQYCLQVGEEAIPRANSECTCLLEEAQCDLLSVPTSSSPYLGDSSEVLGTAACGGRF